MVGLRLGGQGERRDRRERGENHYRWIEKCRSRLRYCPRQQGMSMRPAAEGKREITEWSVALRNIHSTEFTDYNGLGIPRYFKDFKTISGSDGSLGVKT